MIIHFLIKSSHSLYNNNGIVEHAESKYYVMYMYMLSTLFRLIYGTCIKLVQRERYNHAKTVTNRGGGIQ